MSIYDTLNNKQREAVFQTEGPLLVLAGAGSGKTRVLTHRIACLIEEKGVNPWNILAITFTNKAADEMRSRVDDLVGPGAAGVWVSTFHSACVRILRRHIDRLGYGTNFTICDADDQKVLMKDVCKRLNIETKLLREKSILAAISGAKNELITAQEYEKQHFGDYTGRKIAAAYLEYQTQLQRSNALDFDDLIMKTVELLRTCPDVLESYQERFRYIMVDEYQDTNTAQIELVSMLAAKYRNLCVVGDDDQSIYKFRGANAGNILNFEKIFEDTNVIRLEQNYRSTQNILDVANSVISNNVRRKDKKMWTENGQGSQVNVRQFMTAFEEAEFVAKDIARHVRSGENGYEDFAVLYRTNAQSRQFEESFVIENIPYKIIGGVNFYSRKEIKDLLAYLKTVDNARDDLAVRRIVNVPKRGIGDVTLARVQAYAIEQDISFYHALERAKEVPDIGRSLKKLEDFVTFIRTFRSQAEFLGVRELLETIIEATGYVRELDAEDTYESRARIENINELITKAAAYEENAGEPSLSGFLEEVALVADIDSLDEGGSRVVLMTLHSAKGLEFPNVYLTGMEDGVFPSYMGIDGEDPDELEEERRLCYVGITRAMNHLTLTCAMQRMIRGETRVNPVSRFIKEIPREKLESQKDSLKIRTGERAGSLPWKAAQRAVDSPYMQAKRAFQTKAFDPGQFKVSRADSLDYGVGDTVRHIKFGRGVVKQIAEGGRDYEVTVDFERCGVKKMFAAFAKLQREDA